MQYDPDFGWLIKGKCLHSITGGSGDFTGARGVLLMYRGPAGRGEEVNSIYKGEIVLNAMPNERGLQNDNAPAGSAVRKPVASTCKASSSWRRRPRAPDDETA